ncbi:hypothetical protein ACF0H5_009226 [Mactra antiquata]
MGLHRTSILKYLYALDRKLETEAECDTTAFWREINRRKRALKVSPGASIEFNGVLHRGRTDLTEQWAQYFKSLYSTLDRKEFDDNWRSVVTAVVNEIFSELKPDDSFRVSASFVEKSIMSLPTRKAGGMDQAVQAFTEEYIRASFS